MQKRKGFTTVELVIVIAVIAILATALIPTFGGLIKSANHNVDVQAANQLTTLVVMHSVNHPITSERDLADAIDAEMGAGYYAGLQAKSAKYGYNFWYDYKDPQGARVRVGTVEEIAEIANDPARQAKTFSTDDVRLGAAGSTSATHSFGLRADLIDGFVLMGNIDSGYADKNPLLTLVCNLENAAGVNNYADAVSAINSAVNNGSYSQAVKDAVSALQTTVATTVIHNKTGVYALSASVTSVHIPQNTTKLSNDVFVVSNEELALNISSPVIIPSNTTVTTGSLGYLQGDCVVNLSVPADKLPDTIELSATGAIIEVANGDTYKQDATVVTSNIFRPYPDESAGDAISGNVDDETIASLLKSYVLHDNSNDYVHIDTDKKIIYISQDLTDNFQLVAGSFVDSNNIKTSHGIFSWKVTTADGETNTLSNTSKTISINSDVTSIDVTTLGINYTYKVKVAKVERFEVLTIGGLDYGRNISYDATHGVWNLTVDIKLTDEIPLDSLTLDKSISLSCPTGLIKIGSTDPNGNASISILTTVGEGEEATEVLQISGNKSNTEVIFDCAGKKTDTMYISLIDSSMANFDLVTNADSQTHYGFNLHIGTQGHAITLGELFTPKSGVTVTGHVQLSKDGGNSVWKEYPADGWENATLPEDFANLSGNIGLSLALDGGMYSVPLQLTVVKGAWNVASAADWAQYKTDDKKGTDITVLKSFTIDGKNPVDTATEATASTALQYCLDVGAGDVYGNFKVINVIDFYVKATYTYNNIITAGSGSIIDSVIIIGPDYGSKVTIDNSGSLSDGTYVSAVKAASGSTIKNSFLSGFRSPLHASGTVTVTNTTLHLGNYANLYVDSISTLNLTNVTTVQYITANGSMGGGISYKHSAGANQTINATNLKQYNFLTEQQIKDLVKAASAVVPIPVSVSPSDLEAITSVTHTIKGTTYYHLGITAMDLPVLDVADKIGLSSIIGSVADNKPAAFTKGSNLNVTLSENGVVSDDSVVTKQYLSMDAVRLHIWGIQADSFVEGDCIYDDGCGCSCADGAHVKEKIWSCTGRTCAIDLPSTNAADHIADLLSTCGRSDAHISNFMTAEKMTRTPAAS